MNGVHEVASSNLVAPTKAGSAALPLQIFLCGFLLRKNPKVQIELSGFSYARPELFQSSLCAFCFQFLLDFLCFCLLYTSELWIQGDILSAHIESAHESHLVVNDNDLPVIAVIQADVQPL